MKKLLTLIVFVTGVLFLLVPFSYAQSLIPDDYGASDDYDELKEDYITLYKMYLEKLADSKDSYAQSAAILFDLDAIGNVIGKDGVLITKTLDSLTDDAIQTSITQLSEQIDLMAVSCRLGDLTKMYVLFRDENGIPIFGIFVDVNDVSSVSTFVNPIYYDLVQEGVKKTQID